MNYRPIATALLTVWLSSWLWWMSLSLPLIVLPAIAAPQPPPTASPVLPATASPLDVNNIPTEKISRFVHACLQVVTLIEQKETTLQAAETETESLRIEQEIEAAAIAIIEAAGLTHQEYLQLLGLANTDPEFGERVAIQLQEASS